MRSTCSRPERTIATVSSEMCAIRGRTSCMIRLALAVTWLALCMSAPARSTTTTVWSTTGRNRSIAGPTFAAAALMESRAGPIFSMTGPTRSSTGSTLASRGSAFCMNPSLWSCIFRVRRNRANTMPACTTKARQATSTAAATIRKVSSDISDRVPGLIALAYRVAIGLLAGFDGIGQGFLLAADGLLTLIDPPGRSVLDLSAALLNEIGAFFGLFLDEQARFLTRLRREQHSESNSDAQPEQKAGKSVLVHNFLLRPQPISSILRHRNR